MAAGAALLVGLNGLIVMNVVSAVSGSVAALTSNVGKSLSAAEYDCGTSSDDDSTTGTTSIAPNKVAVAIAEAFAKAGYSKASTAGALGVIQFESGMNPEQEQIGETNPALRGFGLNQWTPRSKIQAWMDQHNVSGKDSDADVQIKMLVDTSKSDWNNFYLDNIEAEGYNVTDHDLHKWWLHADNPEAPQSHGLPGMGAERGTIGMKRNVRNMRAPTMIHRRLVRSSSLGRQATIPVVPTMSFKLPAHPTTMVMEAVPS